ncbi:MAG: HlyD family efflux transporter periplasmic adaptor subunit [Pirellulales bacterium]|nr:HlyD family efflux transporter periplasmic adaptor subunit [Pirellulales bacterium]
MRFQTRITSLTVASLIAATAAFAAESTRPASLQVRGILQPLEEITLRSPIDARVKSVYAVAGESVAAGQVLVELDASDLEQDLVQASAGVDQAAAEAALAHSGAERVEKAELRLRTDLGLARSLLSRPDESAAEPGRRRGSSDLRIMRAPLRELADERAATAESRTKEALLEVRMKRSMIDTMQENIESLESQTRVAQRTAEDVLRRYTAVAAPAPATVSDCPVKPHERVSVGQPLATLIETKRIKALVWIPMQHVARVRTGASVTVRAETSRDRVYEGKIARISPQPHPRTGQYLAEVVLENNDGRLRPGMFVDARIDP